MAPEKFKHTMSERQKNGITMESTHMETLPLAGLSMEARKIHIFTEMKKDPLISLGVLCDDGRTIMIEKRTMEVKNNKQKTEEVTGATHTEMR